MKKSPIALGLTLILFAGWLTWLGMQALGVKKPVVVSRAQLAMSEFDIEADLEKNPDGTLPKTVVVKKVLWPAGAKEIAIDQRIDVVNINSATGYVDRGTYLLPLVRRGKDFAVAGLPDDPGFSRESPPARYYPLTAEVMSQWNEARSP